MTGITGLRTHQQQLDIVANNLANMNTIAFKAQTATFSDLIYQNVRTGSGNTETGGEIDPQSIGTGVQLSRISRRFSQGPLQSTGEIFDFAIQGDGFFTLMGQQGENVFTRDGSFTLDSEGRLVDPSSGFRVQRYGDVGESIDGGISFQDTGDRSIRVPLGSAIPGAATQKLEFRGNLPSYSFPPGAEVLSSVNPFQTASGVANSSTLLNDLTINSVDYVPGDMIEINGTNPDGTPFSGAIAADTATMGDLVNELNLLMTGATASLNPDGSLEITADETGDAFLSLLLTDASGNVGSTLFTGNSMVVSTEGNSGSEFELTMDVYDSRGESHRMTFEFRKLNSNAFEVTAGIAEESGVMLDPSVYNLTFNENGTFALAGTADVGDSNIEIQFNSLATPQTIELDFQQLSHLATDYTIVQNQDGYPPGTLVSMAVSSDGVLSGLASNGRTFALAQLALARFNNPSALNPLGRNHFSQTLNAGTASFGTAAVGGLGQVIGGQLESSNVDIAQEFTQLIVAQRGFSANARTITVADQMLEELTNIIR